MAYFEVLDEVLNGEQRFRIRDNDGNILLDNVSIEMITEILQEGTPLNKLLFDKIHVAIEKVGTYSDEQIITQTGTLDFNLDSWDNAIKAEEKTFVLSEKRFFVMLFDIVSISSAIGNTIYKTVIIFDKSTKNLIFLSDNTTIYTGTDFDSIAPNVYVLAKGVNSYGVGVAFLDFNDETNELKLQTGLYNNASAKPSTEQSYTISAGIYEFLANKG